MSRRQAVGALVFHEGKLLLVQRSSNDTYLPNAWELPGGKVERGEDPHTAVSRETLEETGLQCDFGQMSIFKHPSEQTDYHVYLGSSDSTEVTLSDEHQAWDWVTVEEALELLTEEVVSFTPHTAATLVYLTSSLFSLPTFSAEKISKQEFTGYLDWLESGGHYVDLAQEAPRYYELLQGDLTVNEVDADFTHEDEFILLGAEDVPRQGVFVKSFTTTSTIYLHGRPFKRVSGVNHEGKARAYANWMEDKLYQNPNYFRRYRSEEFNYGEDSYDMDLAVAQFLFALIEIRNLLQQGRTEEALTWINDEYLADAVDEIEDDDLRQQVVNLMNQKSAETFESDQIRSLNHPRPSNIPLVVNGYQPKRVEIYLGGVLFYVGDLADRRYSRETYQELTAGDGTTMISIINPSGITLDDVNKLVNLSQYADSFLESLHGGGPSWTGKYWLYTEDEGGKMLEGGNSQSFFAESFEAPSLPFNFPQGVFSNDMSREGMPQLSRQAFRTMQKQGHQLDDIKRVYDRLMCQHSETGPDDVYDFDEYEDGATFTVDISWRCPDCGALGICEDYDFDSYDEFWGTDPTDYPVIWYMRYGRYPQWSKQDTKIVELMPLPEYTDSSTSHYVMRRNAESLTGKDMSYCRCGTDDEVGGFTCGQHCKRIEKNGETFEARHVRSLNHPRQPMPWDLEPNMAEEGMPYLTRREYDSLIRIGYTDEEIRKGYQRSYEAEYTPSQTLGEYDARELALSSVATGDFFTDSLKFSTTRMAAESKAKPSKVEIKKSTSKQHKLMAIFYDSDGDKIKTTHFGWRGMSDYTRHKDKERMKRYDKRHGAKKSGENWKKPMTAGALSKWILWNKPSLKDSFEDYKRRFNLTGDLKVTKSSEEV